MGTTEEILVEEYQQGADIPEQAKELGAVKRGDIMFIGDLPHPEAAYFLEPGGVVTISGGQVGWQPPVSERKGERMTWREVLGRKYEEQPAPAPERV